MLHSRQVRVSPFGWFRITPGEVRDYFRFIVRAARIVRSADPVAPSRWPLRGRKENAKKHPA